MSQSPSRQQNVAVEHVFGIDGSHSPVGSLSRVNRTTLPGDAGSGVDPIALSVHKTREKTPAISRVGESSWDADINDRSKSRLAGN